MALSDRGGAWTRWQCLTVLAAVALVARTADAIPQAQSGAGGGRTPTVRARTCSDCADQEAARRARELLISRLDSLRWEIEHRRLTETERQLAARELEKTLYALEAAQSQMREAQARMALEGDATPGARAVAVTVQSGRMRGYIGVTFDGLWAKPPGATADNLIRFYEYPRVALVDASSPAERAGVLVGDTLLALNGDDVREKEIAFGRLLIPNRRVTMRVRRDGSAHDLVVTVAPAPDYFVRRNAPRPPVVAVGPVTTVEPAGEVQAFSARPRAPTAPRVFWFEADALAGARVETISSGLARALDVPEGILVIRTVPGTPTYDAGLREGDVVTHVGRIKVRGVQELQRALTSGDEREWTLRVVREKKEREITLRW